MIATWPDGLFPRIFRRDDASWQVAHLARHWVERVDDGPWHRSRSHADPEAMIWALHQRIRAQQAAGWSEITPAPGDDRPPRLADTPDALARLHPFRRWPAPPWDGDIDAARRALAGSVQRLASYLHDAAADVPEAVALLQEPGPADAATWGTALFLLAADEDVRRPSARQPAMDVLLEAGPIAALDALVVYLQACADWPALPWSDTTWAQQPGGGFARSPGPWRRVRHALALAPDEVYAAAEVHADHLRQAHAEVPGLGFALAYAFPERPDWSHALFPKRAGRSGLSEARWLLTTTTEPKKLYKLAHDAQTVDLVLRGHTDASEALRAQVTTPHDPWSRTWQSLLGAMDGTADDDVPLSMLAAAGPDAHQALGILGDMGGLFRADHLARAGRSAVFRAWAQSGTPRWGDTGDVDPALADIHAQPLMWFAQHMPRATLRQLLGWRSLDPVRAEVVRRLSPLTAALDLDDTERERLQSHLAAPTEPPPATDPLTRALVAGDAAAVLAALGEASVADVVATEHLWTLERTLCLGHALGHALLTAVQELAVDWVPVRIATDLAMLALDEAQVAVITMATYVQAAPEDPRAIEGLVETLGLAQWNLADAWTALETWAEQADDERWDWFVTELREVAYQVGEEEAAEEAIQELLICRR